MLRGTLAGLGIGLGVLFMLVAMFADSAEGFGWAPVLEFTVGGLIVLVGFYLRHPKKV